MGLSLIVAEEPEQRVSQPIKPAGLNIGLDIEDINKLYTYGGEQGSKIADAENAQATFEDDLRELALKCLASVCRESPDDPIPENRKFEVIDRQIKAVEDIEKEKPNFFNPNLVAPGTRKAGHTKKL